MLVMLMMLFFWLHLSAADAGDAHDAGFEAASSAADAGDAHDAVFLAALERC